MVSKGGKIYVSFTEEIKQDCWNTSFIYADINYKGELQVPPQGGTSERPIWRLKRGTRGRNLGLIQHQENLR